jgi:SAM-dependent methyltransferase
MKDSGGPPPSDWLQRAEWWRSEVKTDSTYSTDVIPLAIELLEPAADPVLDLGCGEGQVMRARGRATIGCDLVLDLLRDAAGAGPVVRAELPDLGWLREGVIGTAYVVMVLEHLPDLGVFGAAHRVVRPGGALVLVMNHPAFMAKGAGPIMDPDDGEVLWRWGRYFEVATVEMATEGGGVVFHHRPLGEILEAAGAAGWSLVRFVERGLSPAAIEAHPGYVGQEQMPRLLGVRWVRS